MTTGAYKNRLGEQRIATALLTRGTEDSVRRAASQWALGSKAKYAIAATRGQFALTGKTAALYYGHPSFWGYHVRFSGLGEPRITNSLFMLASTSSVRKAAQQWTFGKLRQLSVGAAAGAFALTGQAAGLRASRSMPAGIGSFTLTGQAAGLRTSRLLSLEAGAFVLTGNDVVLTYSPIVSVPAPLVNFYAVHVAADGRSFRAAGSMRAFDVGAAGREFLADGSEREFEVDATGRNWRVLH